MIPDRRGLGFNIVPTQFYIGQLSNSNGTLFTAPTGTSPAQKAVIRDIWICNADSSAHTYTLYVVESGGSAADNRAIAKAVSIAANTTHQYNNLGIVLEASGTVQGLADAANKVTVLISGEKLL